MLPACATACSMCRSRSLIRRPIRSVHCMLGLLAKWVSGIRKLEIPWNTKTRQGGNAELDDYIDAGLPHDVETPVSVGGGGNDVRPRRCKHRDRAFLPAAPGQDHRIRHPRHAL